ncbi:putative rapid ALkalinization Factor [Helianthus anomalus]
MMESESNRKTGKRYISYETLRRDAVPCGTHGASYYNCRERGVANPYNRGCEVITFCARDAIINT